MSSIETQKFPAVQPELIHLFFQPEGTLRLTVGEERSYPKVSIYQSSPLRRPGRFISLLDGAGEEIALVDSLESLTTESRTVAEEALRRRYLTSKIEQIDAVRQEFGVSYWDVKTDRGPRDFVVQSLSEACQWLSDKHILLIDVDGNRFEISARTKLDSDSQTRLESVL
ncbi:MAG: DUF1854 domain-containing protein [Armatimonadaceae bacterium]